MKITDISVRSDICDYCDAEHGWFKGVNALAEIPDGVAIPANDPRWQRREELLRTHYQPVVDFRYDDGGWCVCARHLREIADLVEKA